MKYNLQYNQDQTVIPEETDTKGIDLTVSLLPNDQNGLENLVAEDTDNIFEGERNEMSVPEPNPIETNKLPPGVLGMYVPATDQIYVKKDLEPRKKKWVKEHEKNHKRPGTDDEGVIDSKTSIKMGYNPFGRWGTDSHRQILNGFDTPLYSQELNIQRINTRSFSDEDSSLSPYASYSTHSREY